MEVLAIVEIFERFKFSLNESVRFRGENGDSTHADAKMLVINRFLLEEASNFGSSVIYQKKYQCRMSAYGGSGNVVCFGENELMSLDEFEEAKELANMRREELRSNYKRMKSEIRTYFGVTDSSEFHLSSRGIGSDSPRFRVVGSGRRSGEAAYLMVRQIMTNGIIGEMVKVTDPKEIVMVETK